MVANPADRDVLAAFEEAMRDVYVRAKSEAGYNAIRYRTMVERDGGLATAQYLLATEAVSDGFVALWEAGKPELTVEYLVLSAPYDSLFATAELEVARARLGRYAPVVEAPDETSDLSPLGAELELAEVSDALTEDALAGDSAEQREAEVALLAQLSSRLGADLRKKQFRAAIGTRVEVDGYSELPLILVEVWAHQGIAKSAQKAKVLTDALKLLWIEEAFLTGSARKILLLSDDAAAAHFQGRSWMAEVLRHFSIEIVVEDLPADLRLAVASAQVRQFR